MKGCYAKGVVPKPPKIGIRQGGKYADGSVPQSNGEDSTPVKEILQPIANAVTENTGLTGQAVDAIRARQDLLNNLKDGAVNLRGPGTTTSDSIPVHLSKGESVLPAATTRALGARNIAQVIEETNGTAPKVGVRAGGKHAVGAVPNPEDDAAYRAGKAAKEAVIGGIEGAAKPIEMAGKVAMLPYKAAATGLGKALETETQFARGIYGRSPTGFEANMGIEPITAADHARAAASAEQAKLDAAAPQTTPTTTTTTPPAVAPTTTPAPAKPAPTMAPPTVDPVRALANEIMRNQPGVSLSSAMQSAAQSMNVGKQAELHGTQATELAQKTALEAEEAAPGTTAERRAEIRAQRLSKSGDLWTAYQAKDSLGMPTGETVLYNRATGETKPMGGTQPAAAATPVQAGAPTFTSMAEAQAAKAAGKIKYGDVINTPNGPIRVH